MKDGLIMQNLKCIVSYDGTNYSGFQIQAHKNTIQAEIEKTLMKIHKGDFIRIYCSGRTDAGVHAKGQVFHFKTSLEIPLLNWKKAMNTLLPDDIYVMEVEQVSMDFHAQYDAIEKEYRYFVLNSSEPDVFQRNYMYYNDREFNVEKMQEACQLLEGTHDFTSFCSMRSTIKGDKIRTIYELSCNKYGDIIEFKIRGNGFLYHMVRIIVGMLLDVGCGKTGMEAIEQALEQKDRTVAGVTIPPEGLYLWNVTYKE